MRADLFRLLRWEHSFGLIVLLFLANGSACSRQTNEAAALQSVAGTPDVQPTEADSSLSQLRRYLGQSKFLNVTSQVGIVEQAEIEEESPEGKSPSGARDIQEADLFKLGVPGSKIIYLLNQYRGLQVVDFTQGAKAPRLLGRTAATGNEPLEMYFDSKRLQIILLERGWGGQNGGYGSVDRILVYSVADPVQARLVQTIALEGALADSRLVGNVLYVATSRWNFFPDGSSPRGEGKVSAFRLLDQGLSLASSQQLSLPISELENMNIVEANEGDLKRYYLISVLSENRFDWSNRKSTIEVLDISDPEGEIKPLLMASVAGEIGERSSTQIKDRTLLTVSNSFFDKGDGSQQLRVTVESFKLPSADSPSIDAREAEFRRVWFEREMQKRPAEEDAIAYAAKLQSDPALGLKGVFVKQLSGGLAKILPDQSISVGDDTGQHADLQDVRFVGDKLYIFWVPANQIDPLDVFDIKDPGNQLRYLGRTLFEGWIERAIPLIHQGKDYIIGLGWVVPPTNPEGKRYPQAILFGAEEGSYKPLAQLTLSQDDIWSYFNDEDKSILVQTKDDGTGTIIFPATVSQEGGSQSGGKMISYNLNFSAGPNYLVEGPLLASDAEWLRRVFENPELEKIHNLTDRSLGTYDLSLPALSSNATAASNQVIKAISTLELARNIVAYTEVDVGGKKFGVQIIDKGFSGGNSAQTAVRVVETSEADAELPATRLPRELAGSYQAHLLASDGSLLVLTSRDLEVSDGSFDSWSQELRLARLKWTPNGEVAINSKSQTIIWREEGSYSDARSKIFPGGVTDLYQMDQLSNGEIMVRRGRNVRIFNNQEKLSIKNASDPLACVPISAKDLRFTRLGAADYFSYALPVSSDEPEYAQLSFLRYFLAPMQGDTVDCSKSINVPGRPLRLEAGHLITEEDRFLGFNALGVMSPVPEEESVVPEFIDRLFVEGQLWPEKGRVLHALRLEGQKAVLSDIYSLEAVRSSILSETKGLYFTEQPQSWGPRFVAEISLDQSGRFVRKSLLLPLPTLVGEDVHLLKVLTNAEEEPYFLMQVQRQGYVLKKEKGLLKAMPLRFLGSVVPTLETVNYFPIYEWFPSESGIDERLSYDPLLQRLSYAQGLWGVQGLEIVKNEVPQ